MKRCRSRAAVRWEWLAALTAVLVARPPAAAAQGPPPSPAAESGSPADLTTRFHFLERFSSTRGAVEARRHRPLQGRGPGDEQGPD